MPFYLLHDADTFARMTATLAACRSARSFAPSQHLFAEWRIAARRYADLAHLGPEPMLAERVADGLTFDRDRWRAVVAELLWVAAVDWPMFPVSAPALGRLVGPDIRPVLVGARELTLGVPFRPDTVGWCDRDDVAHLSATLAKVDPSAWQPADLAGLPGLEGEDEEGLADELDVVRQGLVDLRTMFTAALSTNGMGRVIVVEHE